MNPYLKKPRPAPVTIIVGIICKDAIVLASDSQITTGNSKQTDASKIEIVQFQNMPVMVAQSGLVAFSGRLLEIFEKMAEHKAIGHHRDVGEVAQSAVRQLRQEIRGQRGDCSMDEVDEWLRRNGLECELVMGFFFREKPYLYSINLALGVASQFKSYYGTSGCGGNLGQFMLAEHSKPEMDRDFATTIAIYTVDTVKDHDAFCGGPTRVGVMQLRHQWWLGAAVGSKNVDISILPQDDVDEFSTLIKNADLEAREGRNQKMYAIFEEKVQRRISDVLAAIIKPDNDNGNPKQ